MRTCLLTLMLVSSGAWAQDACTDRCGAEISNCIGKCAGDARCSNGCTKRLSDCMGRCDQKPAKGASKAKKCMGANGKNVPCPDYREPKRAKVNEPPEEEYPNKGAKDLSKDPNFKVE